LCSALTATALLLLLLLLQAKKQKAAELEVRRKEHVRAAIMGQNFIEGECGLNRPESVTNIDDDRGLSVAHAEQADGLELLDALIGISLQP
jgi:hypothetical protein